VEIFEPIPVEEADTIILYWFLLSRMTSIDLRCRSISDRFFGLAYGYCCKINNCMMLEWENIGVQ
jgi:hypothetical protein